MIDARTNQSHLENHNAQSSPYSQQRDKVPRTNSVDNTF